MPYMNMPGSTFRVFRDKVDFNTVAGNDVCIVQRCCTQPQFEFLRTMRQLELKIVYDLDDNMWQIPETNPAHEVLGHYKDGFIACMQWVDVISVSTKQLAKVVRNFTGKNMATGKHIPVMVAENRLDERLFSLPNKREEVIVGWAGSSSHVGDLAIVTDSLKQCMEEFPKVLFEFRGMEPDDAVRAHGNYRFKYWMPVSEFCARMPQWGWSIALAPLTEHDFNISKSCIKVLEAAYCRVPCLASWVEPYDRFTSYDPELRWLLCAGPSSWAPKLRELINDPARREDLGNRAYKVMHEHFSYKDKHEEWEAVFEAARG